MNMYNHVDRDGTRLLVSKDEEAVVGLRHLGALNSTSLNANEAVKFAEAVLKAAGSDALVVRLVEDNEVRSQGKELSCGYGNSQVYLRKNANLSNLDTILSNMATLTVFLRQLREAEQRVDLDREEVAKLLGIEMPKAGDVEGLRALDEMVKRRKGL